MTVEVYSGAERVRLYLNDKLIGEKPTGRDQQFKAEFEVEYTTGTLKAVGIRGDRTVAESILQTTGEAARLKLTADRTIVDANGQDLAFVTVEAVDEKGHLQMSSNQKIHVAVSGEGTIAAVGSGDGQSRDSYSGDTVNLFSGRALVVLRATRKPGPIKLTSTADGLTASILVVESKSAERLAELR